MPYLIKRGKRYSYKRRVPNSLREHDHREHVVIPLKTDSESLAHQKSIVVNEHIERYWEELIHSTSVHTAERFKKVSNICALLNFTYKSTLALSEDTLPTLINRLTVLEQVKSEPMHVEAIMGGADVPTICISQAMEKYWKISNHELLNKSPDQIRKWKNPRKKAIKNFIAVCGDKELTELQRDDLVQFRDWWIHRIETEGRAVNTVNKELGFFKSVVEKMNDHVKLNIDTDWLFRNYSLKKQRSGKREPFENDFIQNEMLNTKYHTGLIEEAKYILYSLADTGARPAEIINLMPEDILLECHIPHIKIRPRKNRQLKTPYSERDIPLVGCALWAFQQMSEGFPHYRNMKSGSDNLSATLNAHLRRRKLLPSTKHTLYSLRHSFQDRLTNIGVPDRIQVQLMGHKFADRIEYGNGANLEKKQEWLLKICFKPPAS